MKKDSHTSKLLVLSVQLYRTLLILYPADFRQEYGQPMLQVFRDGFRDVYRQGGVWELAHWWVAILFDLIETVIVEHRKAGLMMSQAKLIRWTGWLFLLGGIFFLASGVGQLQLASSNVSDGLNQLSLYALVPGMVLVMLGLLGLWLRYNLTMNLFGKLALLVTLLGAAIMSFGWLLTLLLAGGFWSVFMVGWLIQLAGQSVFGGFAVTTHLLPKWNFTLLIGSAFPLTVVVLGLRGDPSTFGLNGAAFVILLLIGSGWLLTGWALNSQPDMSVQPVVGT